MSLVAQIDPGLLAPVQVRHQHRVAFLGQLVRHFAHGGVDPEDLLAEHHARAAAIDGRSQVGLELLAGIRADVDIMSLHCDVSSR